MSEELRFEEEQIKPVHRDPEFGGFSYQRYDPRLRVPTFVRFLMRARIVRTEKAAEKLLISVCVLLCIIAIAAFVWGIREPEITRLKLTI